MSIRYWSYRWDGTTLVRYRDDFTFRRTPVPGTGVGARRWGGGFREFSTVPEARANESVERLDDDAIFHRVRVRLARTGSRLPDPWDDPWDGAPRARRGNGWKHHRRRQHRGR